MAHEVVNSPETGAVTWCSGLGCPRCDADREMNERLSRGETVTYWVNAAAGNYPPVRWRFPNATAANPVVIPSVIPLNANAANPYTYVRVGG